MIAQSGMVARTTNFINWESLGNKVTSTSPKTSTHFWRGLESDGTNLFALHEYDVVSRSTDDGYNWTLAKNLGEGDWKNFACRNNTFIVQYTIGGWRYSKDGMNWIEKGTPIVVPLDTVINGGIVYKNGKWYAMYRNIIYVSKDEISTWSTIENSLTGISTNKWMFFCDNGPFLALCDDGSVAEGTISGKSKFTNITSSSSNATQANYEYIDDGEFFIEPSQITGQDANGYYIDFNMTNIRLISAEITNRPYKKMTPTCSLSGATNVFNGFGTAIITTNVEKSLSIKAKTNGDSSITFHNENGIKQNAGKHTISGTKEFIFDSGFVPNGEWWMSGMSLSWNFDGNLSKYKVRYSLSNVSIVNCKLENQMIRDYIGLYSNAISIPNVNTTVSFDEYRDSCVKVVTANPQYKPRDNSFVTSIKNGGNEYITMTYGIALPFTTYSVSADPTHNIEYYVGNSIIKSFTLGGSHWRGTNFDKGLSYSGESVKISSNHPSGGFFMALLIQNPTPKLFKASATDDDILYNRYVGLQNLSTNLTSRLVAGNYIVFQGGGKLSVTVAPLPLSGNIKHTTPQSTTATTSITSSKDQTLTISPESHKYEKQSDGNYRITLNLTNVQISDVQMVDKTPFIVYSPLRLPQMSRTVDFSKNINNNPQFESNLVVYSHNINGTNSTGYRGAYYDEMLKHWCTMRSSNYNSSNDYGSFCHHFWNKNIEGDFYFSLDQINDEVAKIFTFTKGAPTDLNSKNSTSYNIPGFYRYFQTFNSLYENNKGFFDLRLGDPKYALMNGGFTLPINVALYAGASGTTLNTYKWQDPNNLTDMTDPTISSSRVTTDACAKLKTTYGTNLRVYVVKYRKQTAYKQKILGANVNFNYGYLDDCASDSKYVYDVTTEAALKTALDAIAADIKSAGFTNYQPARNVD